MKRDIRFTVDFIENAHSSVLIENGKTKVLCTVTFEENVPPFLRDKNQGWLTAEYSMLPGSTKTRNRREVNSGKVSGRTAEIQRLIGRSLRAVVDLTKFPGMTAFIDCDVLQADGGTRTASITGASLALYLSFLKLLNQGKLTEHPMKELIGAISVGIVEGSIESDLCYEQDSIADVDFNVVMTESGKFVEVQGTAENNPFSFDELNKMLSIAYEDIKHIIHKQKEVITQINK